MKCARKLLLESDFEGVNGEGALTLHRKKLKEVRTLQQLNRLFE